MAATVNQVFLLGRLGRDPELKYSQSGTPICTFSMATDEGYRDKQTGNRVDKAEWHRIVIYRALAEAVANALSKGSLCHVSGKLQTRQWQDQQGQTRHMTEIVAHSVQFLDGRQDRGQGAQRPPQPQQQAPAQRPAGGTPPAFPSEAAGMDTVPF